MRILIVSDIHSNLVALDAVLADAAGAWEMIWSLGDIVGYGPQPNECIARLNEHTHVAIPGNHDWGVLARLDLDDFNTDARLANLWTREQLGPLSRSYLEALPETRVEGEVTLAHGSPRHPIWEYLIYPNVTKQSFGHFQTPLCFVGHTHLPVIFRDEPTTHACQPLQPLEAQPLPLDEARYIINPGSVGQPRDGDPRAAYMLFDIEARTIEHRRVAYDIAATQKRMRAANLPQRLIARLEVGW